MIYFNIFIFCKYKNILFFFELSLGARGVVVYIIKNIKINHFYFLLKIIIKLIIFKLYFFLIFLGCLKLIPNFIFNL